MIIDKCSSILLSDKNQSHSRGHLVKKSQRANFGVMSKPQKMNGDSISVSFSVKLTEKGYVNIEAERKHSTSLSSLWSLEQ